MSEKLLVRLHYAFEDLDLGARFQTFIIDLYLPNKIRIFVIKEIICEMYLSLIAYFIPAENLIYFHLC